MRLLILADTHIPRRARDLPPQLWTEVDQADVVCHAGDWVTTDLLDRLDARAARLIAVYGNNDGPLLRARLPEIASADLDGLAVSVIHDTGPTGGRESRAASRFPGADVLIFGHSHIPWDTVTANGRAGGLRLLNPGSPTDRRRQPVGTFLTAEIADGRLSKVTLRSVPPPTLRSSSGLRRAGTAGSSRPGGTPGSA